MKWTIVITFANSTHYVYVLHVIGTIATDQSWNSNFGHHSTTLTLKLRGMTYIAVSAIIWYPTIHTLYHIYNNKNFTRGF